MRASGENAACLAHGTRYAKKLGCPECKREESSKAAGGIDRALKKTAGETMTSYDADARAIARVLSRHYGDEAQAVLDRARHFLDGGRS